MSRYGFVVYADPSVTDIACQGLNGLKMGDRVLTVRRATEVRKDFIFDHNCLEACNAWRVHPRDSST